MVEDARLEALMLVIAQGSLKRNDHRPFGSGDFLPLIRQVRYSAFHPDDPEQMGTEERAARQLQNVERLASVAGFAAQDIGPEELARIQGQAIDDPERLAKLARIAALVRKS